MAHRMTFLRLRHIKRCIDVFENDVIAINGCGSGGASAWSRLGFGVDDSQRNRHLSTISTSTKYSAPFLKRAGELTRPDVASTLSILIRNASSDEPSGEKCKRRTEVTYEELLELIKEGETLVIDVREPKEIEQTGLMPGAINIPITKLKSSLSLSEGEFQEVHKSQKPAGQGENLLFCGFSNVKSETALELAHKAGYKKARHFPGGWKEWSEKNPQ